MDLLHIQTRQNAQDCNGIIAGCAAAEVRISIAQTLFADFCRAVLCQEAVEQNHITDLDIAVTIDIADQRSNGRLYAGISGGG